MAGLPSLNSGGGAAALPCLHRLSDNGAEFQAVIARNIAYILYYLHWVTNFWLRLSLSDSL